MLHYWAEVKHSKTFDKDAMYELMALHETTSLEKPHPKYGGDNCICIADVEYNILTAVKGDPKEALRVAKNMCEWLTLPKE